MEEELLRPLCSGSMASYEGRLMKCKDRDVVAVLNLQMRGEGFPQRALDSTQPFPLDYFINETSSIST
ncbi:MAG: hypothetical protein JTT16_05145 [Candidatus Brockarchaeota archaeon]|nr:hypothetical protein [Candidatus Brockarchaeota archaeon]MBO3768674.1 hypothetical protein [Candidatus Brockarchaeota archaeon]